MKIFISIFHRFLGHLAYHRLAKWIWKQLGKKNRKILSACAVLRIHAQFSSEEYVGFKDALYWIEQSIIRICWTLFDVLQSVYPCLPCQTWMSKPLGLLEHIPEQERKQLDSWDIVPLGILPLPLDPWNTLQMEWTGLYIWQRPYVYLFRPSP